MLYPMKRDVGVVFSASYVAHGVRLLIYVLYNLKAWVSLRLPLFGEPKFNNIYV